MAAVDAMDVLSCATHSESRTSKIYYVVPVSVPVRAISERNPIGDVGGDGKGGPSSAAGASDNFLPITPAPPAPAPPAASPGGPAVTTAVDAVGTSR